MFKKIIKKCFPSIINRFNDIVEIKYLINNTKILTEETRHLTNDTRIITEETRDLTKETRQSIEDIKQQIGLLNDSDFQITRLKKMLNEVEYYQPAYMIGGINLIPQRECKNRCRIIEKSLNNNVAGSKILDIGSSLGYICYYFADRGAVTEGWESNPKNVEVARLIGQINGIPTKFKNQRIMFRSIR